MRDQKRTSNLYTPKNVTAEPLRYQHSKGEPNVRCSTPAPRITALVSLSATLVLALARLAGATTLNANSASESDVAAVIGSAKNGDTVIIPGGTTTWTRTLSVRKAITIQGAGIGVTIVKDGAQKGALIDWTLAAGQLSRLTGIEFQDGGRTNIAPAPGGILHVDGSNTNGSMFRWDHCKWNDLNGYPVIDTVLGVIDHCSFIISDKQRFGIYFYGSHWTGQEYGDGSWVAPINYGSSGFIFVEDCDIRNIGGGLFYSSDAFAGARVVIRHCTIHNLTITTHGTESTGRERGARAIEVYNNTFTGTNLNSFVAGTRSGGMLVHDNSISGYWGNSAQLTLNNFRGVFPFSPWGGADGTNAWDVNDPTVFFTGTAASNSSGLNVTVSGANWTANRWAGYTLRRTSNSCNLGGPNFGLITSNSSNTITWADGSFGNMAICAGDSLEIRKVNHSLDQPGRGQGTLITGVRPTPPSGWNNQVTEPCYSWNNITNLGGHVNFAVSIGSIRAGVHYFNDTAMPGYTPYIYPHPLTKGLPPPELMTRNATGISQRKPVRKRQPWGGKKLDGKKAKKAKASPTDEMPDGPESLGH